MRMTKQRAKELAIIIWTKLVETGLSYIQKIAIVDELYANSTITEREQDLLLFNKWNPLCVAFKGCSCHDCPLHSCGESSVYRAWKESTDKQERIKYATEILDSIKDWEV